MKLLKVKHRLFMKIPDILLSEILTYLKNGWIYDRKKKHRNVENQKTIETYQNRNRIFLTEYTTAYIQRDECSSFN